MADLKEAAQGSTLFDQLAALYPAAETLDASEFSQGITQLEKRLLQFALGSAYVQSNRVLGEYTLTLKETGVTSPQRSKEEEESDENDAALSQSILVDLVREAKDQGGKRTITKREIQAIDTLLMDNNILQSELSSLKSQTTELLAYKAKYEKLQSDIQNNAIASQVDSKQILLDFKQQNERQLELITTLKDELERMRKENDVYRRFNKQSSGANQSGAILERLIEKSQKELVDFKNVQLKKVERPAEEVKTGPQVPQKSSFVTEQSSGVSALKNMFDPAARQKALEKSMTKVEQELAKGQEQAREQLAQAQQ